MTNKNRRIVPINKKRNFTGKPIPVKRLKILSCFGIAISCIPSLLSVIFQKKWLNFFSVVLVLIVIIIAIIYESKGKLK